MLCEWWCDVCCEGDAISFMLSPGLKNWVMEMLLSKWSTRMPLW